MSSNNDFSGNGIFSASSILKYGTLLLSIISELLYFQRLKRQRRPILLKKEFQNFEWYFIVLIVLTFFSAISSMQFSLRIIQTFIFVFFPIFYAFLVINTWTLDQIKFCFKIGFIIAFIGYLISTGVGLSDIFNSLTTINYQDTNSTTLESSTFALLALGFSGYFCYFKEGFFWKIISVLFVVMTFKRQITLTAFVLLFLGFFSIKKRKMNWLFAILLGGVLIIFAFMYYQAIKPENILEYSQNLGIDLRSFSTNRTDRLNWLDHSTFVSYGFGSSTDYMYKVFGGFALEMDIVQLFVEMGPIAVISFIVSYLLFARKNIYVFIFMCLLLINSILSSGMASTFAWVIIFIGMAAVLKISKIEQG